MKVETKIEPELGEVIEYVGFKAKCVEGPDDENLCQSCAFHGLLRCDIVCCTKYERKDNKEVYFIKVQ